MKPTVTEVHGRTASGRIGTRYEHNLKIGDKVKHVDGRDGVIVGDGMAGMPEIEMPDGVTCMFFPQDLTVI
jgi:hypothetical protein